MLIKQGDLQAYVIFAQLIYFIMPKDIYGNGLQAYLEGDTNAFFTVESSIAETEQWPVSLFFRNDKDMPEIEKIALSHVQGKTLDIGAGAGSHALLLQEKNIEVTAIDISPKAVEVMKKRGVTDARIADFFHYKDEKYDTLLLLMNGIGITGELKNLPLFFKQAKQLLRPDGKIILDSSNILYLFEDEDGEVVFDIDDPYYGEMEYRFVFKGEADNYFPWLFIDFDTLAYYAKKSGFSYHKIYEDEHFLYLAELKPIK